MKIHLSSDLHLEFEGNPRPTLPQDADVIVLAGDISLGLTVHYDVARYAKQHPNAHILFVPGNHEYYSDGDFSRRRDEMRDQIDKIPNAHFMDRDTVSIDGVVFLGATLWSGFDIQSNLPLHAAFKGAQRGLNDFHQILHEFVLLTPEEMAGWYKESKSWLRTELQKHADAKCVVITHFAPTMATQHGTIPVGPLTSYFQANCGDLIEEFAPPLWLYGHNHWNKDFKIGDTRLVANQGGYPGEVTDYNSDLLIEL